MARHKFAFIAMITLLMSVGLIVVPILATETTPTTRDGEIIYRTGWTWGDAVPTDNGWTVTNDLGVVVTVEKAYLVNFAVQLLECEDHSHTTLLESLLPDTARAGHGDGINPALVDSSFVEDFAHPDTIEFGKVTVESLAYCEAHYLIARAGSETRFQPEDVDMYGVSLYVEGTYQNVDSDETFPFTAQTHLANGKQLTLHLPDSTMPVHVEVGEERVEILVQRQLDRLFDGIDFTSTGDIGRAILWNIIASTEFIVTGGNAH
ncbi:MAG: hypothetical protein L0154_12100 [Chloroflexi bacterium]|nr:hypothetical protein [Chloroflexota bacterium]